MAPESLKFDETLVRRLVADQFPQWAGMPVHAVPQSGWDNRTFRIGDDLVARLPSAHSYEPQVRREQRCLPHLRRYLPVEIPEPVALGCPGHGYPWSWSVYRWIAGDTAASSAPSDMGRFAEDLGAFLWALQRTPAAEGPKPGRENFHRGGMLVVYDAQFRQAIVALGSRLNSVAALAIWNLALTSTWTEAPVWVHGDVAPGNLLVRGGRLAGVIDFGQVCVGDPACDLAIAWTYLAPQHRHTFRTRLALDSDTWQRGQAWALWKAAIVASGLVQTNAVERQLAWGTLDQILIDPAHTEA